MNRLHPQDNIMLAEAEREAVKDQNIKLVFVDDTPEERLYNYVLHGLDEHGNNVKEVIPLPKGTKQTNESHGKPLKNIDQDEVCP